MDAILVRYSFFVVFVCRGLARTHDMRILGPPDGSRIRFELRVPVVLRSPEDSDADLFQALTPFFDNSRGARRLLDFVMERLSAEVKQNLTASYAVAAAVRCL